ncbi:MAG: sensor histidine kinase [Methylococcaceae bacterium]|nr:sensor histidine kinase [Methylococcaceae bacterium]
MKSLRLQLGIGLSASVFTVFILLWWLTSNSIRNLAEESVAEHLEHDAISILEALSIDAANNLKIDITRVEPIYLKAYSGDYYQVISSGQVIVSKSLAGQPFTLQPLAVGTSQKHYVTGPKHQPLIMMVYGYNKLGRDISIAIAEDLSPTFARITAFQKKFTTLGVALAVSLISIQNLILGRGFRRLTRITQQIKDLEQGSRTQLDTRVPQELAALVHEINWLLQVLEQRLQRSRHALADLAHALKTPLTVLQQLLRLPEIRNQPQVYATLQSQTNTIQQMMERVLKRARVMGAGGTVVKFDINQEIPPLIKVLESMYSDKQLHITYSIPANGLLLIDREDVLELTGNLLDNACKWAKSKVHLTLELQPVTQLVIEDDGPGVSHADLAKLCQRGTRLDEAVSGHGLGLAIVRAIVEQYGGQLKLQNSLQLGGFSATVLFKVF